MLKGFIRSAVSAALLFVTTSAFSSTIADKVDPVFDHLSMRQGLSHSAVVSITQDRLGFVWVGTNEGLNRYDGHRFVRYFHDPDDPSTISHDFIYVVRELSDGSLLIGTDRGLNQYDQSSDSFTMINIDVEDRESSGSHNQVKAIYEDDRGRLWIGTGEGVVLIEGDERRHFHHDPLDPRSISPGPVRAIAQTEGGELWFGTEGGGLARLDSELTSFSRYYSGVEPESLPDNTVRDLEIDGYGRLWISTFNGGVVILDPETNEMARPDATSLNGNPKALRSRALFRDSENRIWIGTDAGVFMADPTLLTQKQYSHVDSDPGSLSDNLVTDVYEDSSGVLWFATYNGISKWNTKAPNFSLYRVDKTTNGGLVGDSITAFTETDSRIYVGTMQGLTVYEKAKDLYAPSSIEMDDSRVMALNVDKEGALWIGTMTGGLTVMSSDGTQRIYQTKSADPGSLASNQVSSITTDSQNRTWIGMYGAGVDLHTNEGRFIHFGIDKIPDLKVIALEEDYRGRIWVGTNGGGVAVIDVERDSIVELRHRIGVSDSLSSDNVVALTSSATGMWIGTRDAGLNFFSYETSKISRISKAQGLASVAAYGIQIDDEGKAWVSGGKGISVIKDLQVIASYDKTHGLQADDFNSGASFKTSDGTMLFGGNEGFNAFDPSKIAPDDTPPKIAITGFKKLNEPVLFSQHIDEAGKLEIEHSDYVIEFAYGAMDYAAPHRNQYKYMLRGFDPDWVDAGNTRNVTYTNLDPGTYQFKVQGTNHDGVWSPEIAEVSLIVKPPLWLTWWAYALYALAFCLATYYAFVLNSNRLKRVAEKRYNERLQLYIESLEEASDSILIADAAGTLLYANNTIAEGLKKPSSEVIGSSIWDVLFDDAADVEVARESLVRSNRYHGEISFGSPDDNPVTHEVTIAAVRQASRNELAYVGISRDVTERKVAETQLEAYRKNLEELVEERTERLVEEIAENKATQASLAESLQEKELLIKEVHHRVKNNMQVISSLLSIQAEGVGDDRYVSLLNESQQRIKSMALIHETLYQSKDLLKIDFQEYIDSLATSLSRSYIVPGVEVMVSVKVEDVELDLDTAVPCGLIINEVVSNALKHAFEGKDGPGLIDISFVSDDHRFYLKIADNGRGLPEDFDCRNHTSMGMEIVTILTSQLEGNLKSSNDEGAVFEIDFPRYADAH